MFEFEKKESLQAYAYIPIDDLIIEEQPFEEVDDWLYEEIKKSIARNGILNPLLVAKTEKGYVIQEGRTRYQIAKELGLKTVPCVISDNLDPQNIYARMYDAEVLRRPHTKEEVIRYLSEKEKKINKVTKIIKQQTLKKLLEEAPEDLKQLLLEQLHNHNVSTEEVSSMVEKETIKIQEELLMLKNKLQDKDKELKEKESKIKELENLLKKVQEEINIRDKALNKIKERFEEEKEKIIAEIKNKYEEQVVITADETFQQEKKQLEEKIEQKYRALIEEKEKELEEAREQWRRVSHQLRQLMDERNQKQEENKSLSSKIKLLEKQIKNYEDYNKKLTERLNKVSGTETLLKRLQNIVEELDSIHEILIARTKEDFTETEIKKFLNILENIQIGINRIQDFFTLE